MSPRGLKRTFSNLGNGSALAFEPANAFPGSETHLFNLGKRLSIGGEFCDQVSDRDLQTHCVLPIFEADALYYIGVTARCSVPVCILSVVLRPRDDATDRGSVISNYIHTCSSQEHAPIPRTSPNLAHSCTQGYRQLVTPSDHSTKATTSTSARINRIPVHTVEGQISHEFALLCSQLDKHPGHVQNADLTGRPFTENTQLPMRQRGVPSQRTLSFQ